jgi:uncharacterized membrane protein
MASQGAAPAPAAGSGSSDNIIGLLCYSPVGLIADIFVLVAEPYKNSKFLRFHAFQSLFLCGAAFAVSIGLGILGMILGMVAGPLALIIVPVQMLFGLAILGVCILMMIKAYGMQMTELPVIGKMAAGQANK